MKYPSRVVTSCDSCRKLKRKCDFMQVRNGPCSNCRMRNIGHLCSLANDAQGGESSIRNGHQANEYPIEVRSQGLLSLVNAGNALNGVISLSPYNGSPSDAGTDSAPSSTSPNSGGSPPQHPVNIQTKLPLKLFSSCVVRFFQTPELGFFLDQDPIVAAVMGLARPSYPDLPVASLLFILCAVIVIRRGASLSQSIAVNYNRQQLGTELFNLHVRTVSFQKFNSLQCLQTMILRGHYFVDIDNNDEAWKTYFQALTCYKSLRTELANNRSMADKLKLDRALVALGNLEWSLCAYTGKRPSLTLEFANDLDNCGDFKLQRRWNVLALTRKVQLILEEGASDDIIIKEQDALEHDIADYIELIDKFEGRLVPYGQIYLLILLIKLRTQKVLRTPVTGADARYKLLQQLSDNGNDLAEYLDDTTSRWAASGQGLAFLGTAPLMAMNMFQGLTCIWILAALSKREQSELGFEHTKERLWSVLSALRPDSKVCKKSSILFHGMDILEKSQSEEDGRIKIPLPLRSTGMSSITKPWNDSVETVLTAERNSESWMNIQANVDDSMLWSMLVSQSEFDDSLQFMMTDSKSEPDMLIFT
jgi:hypothetical protein